MSRLPVITPKQLVAALKRMGFYEHHQKGSHLYLRHPDKSARTTVAMHNRDLSPKMLKTILKQAGVSDEEFLENL